MGWLDNLKSNLKNIHIGSWGTPDLGVTEAIADIKGAPRDPTTGGSQNYGSMATSPSYTQNINQAKQLASQRQASSSQKTTNNGGNTTLNNSPTNPGTDLVTNENNNYNSRVKASQDRLKSLVDDIRWQMGQADTTRDYLKGSANDMYYGNTTDDDTTNDVGLFGLSKNKRESSLKAIADELSGVVNTYEGIDGKGGLIQGNRENQGRMNDQLDQTTSETGTEYSKSLGSNQRAIDSAMTRNRMRARASGTLGSSFYDTAQNQTENTGMANAGGLLQERAGKVADIGRTRGENNQWYEQKDVGLKTELGNKKSALGSRKTDTETYFDKFDLDLGNELKTSVQAIDDEWAKTRKGLLTQEQIYGINNEEELAQLDYDHNQSLNQIQQYVMNKQNVRDALASKATGFSSTLNSRPVFGEKASAVLADKTQANDMNRATVSDQLKSTLENNSARNKAGSTDYSQYGVDLVPSTIAQITNMLRYRKPTQEGEDPYGYYLNTD